MSVQIDVPRPVNRDDVFIWSFVSVLWVCPELAKESQTAAAVELGHLVTHTHLCARSRMRPSFLLHWLQLSLRFACLGRALLPRMLVSTVRFLLICWKLSSFYPPGSDSCVTLESWSMSPTPSASLLCHPFLFGMTIPISLCICWLRFSPVTCM